MAEAAGAWFGLVLCGLTPFNVATGSCTILGLGLFGWRAWVWQEEAESELCPCRGLVFKKAALGSGM